MKRIFGYEMKEYWRNIASVEDYFNDCSTFRIVEVKTKKGKTRCYEAPCFFAIRFLFLIKDTNISIVIIIFLLFGGN